ncbi:hypothetical protein [Roseateles sp. LYH14W]|uniref:Uncharacterized protein n=1 Tax=Pelomonas parva TaxID=3299032 RepID=A0ABW7F7G9_9BURK
MLTAPVKLEDPHSIPKALRQALNAHDREMRATRDTESLIRGGPLDAIADALSEHLCAQRIHGYHCTREPEPGYFKRHGLRATNLRAHQDEFLHSLGHHFTDNEQSYMRKQWAAYFDAGQVKSREGKVWACLTRSLAVSHGTKPFFRAYGGEAIHMPLADDSSVIEKLKTLGEPVIVEVALPGDAIRTYCDMAWCALNYHHRRINPDAYPMDSEAWLGSSVRQNDVLDVVKLQDFLV